MTIELAGERFANKTRLLERIRGILYAYPIGGRLNTADRNFLYALVDMHHPDGDLKIGVGVARMEVRQNRTYRNNREFWIVRTDGTETDFSFMECLRPSTPLSKFKNACRVAVALDVAAVKADFWRGRESAVCPLTGSAMTFADSHVHHAGPFDFAAIVQSFIAQDGIEVSSVQLTGIADGEIGDRFNDPELERRFVAYHNNLAQLQVVSAFGNLSTARTSTGPIQPQLL